MNDRTNSSLDETGSCGLTRRQLLKTSALLGGTALAATQAPWLLMQRTAEARYLTPVEEYALAKPENILYTACLQCQIRCNLKVKVLDGLVVKVDGSPYSAKQLLPNIGYGTSPADAALLDGKVCAKGQASIQTLYDPYRIRKVLKRVGPRGSGQWETIGFDKAIDEIVNGGDLFGEGPVAGFKEVHALGDAAAAAEMAKDIDALKKKEIAVADFKGKHAASLGALIDPDHPDLGPKNNQLVFLPGRINRGRVHFAKRFVNDAFGSVNVFPHTSICELSIFTNTSEMTRDLATGKSKNHFKADFLNSEFVIFWGTGFADANFGLTPMAELVTKAMTERGLKFAVIDPRLSKSAAKAWKWVPIRPATDSALALGMIRWIIENGRYDGRYLENPNLQAAQADGETTSTDATHLVRTDTMTLLRAEDLGMEVPPPEEGKPKLDFFVVMTEGGPKRHDEAEAGLLEVDTTLSDISVKSVFTLLKERAFERSVDEYAEIAGVSGADVAELAHEFTSHGKRAAIEIYRGVAQHTNGFYTVQATNTLNILIGNMDWKGGLADGGGSWDDLGGKEGQPYPLASMNPNKTKAFGVTMSREGWKYEDSTLFERDGGYPAQRPWFPFASEIYHDIIPAAEAGYPYPIKILWLHMGTPGYSVPGSAEQLRILRDRTRIPLFIATDIVIGDTSMYADYIFPDLSFLERWASPGDVPQPAARSNPFRQPVAAPIPETVTVDGEETPISMEAIMLAIAQRLGLPGFGADGFGPGVALKRPEDYYLKIAGNLAFGDKADGSDSVPDADDAEVELLTRARRHLPAEVFDLGKWQAAVKPELWRKVVFVLNRGGRFEHLDKVYEEDHMHHKFGGTFHLYIERVSKQKDSVTGQRYDGIPRYHPPQFSSGGPVADDQYEFQLITYKEAFGTNGRTSNLYWAQDSLQPENFVLMNKRDADRLQVSAGDRVKLVSASLPDGTVDLGEGRRLVVAGKARPIEGVRPGVVVVSHHYGHWAYGAADVVISGERWRGDERRGKGLNPNALMRLDEHTKTGPLSDPIGGSAVFYDTRVSVVKA